MSVKKNFFNIYFFFASVPGNTTTIIVNRRGRTVHRSAVAKELNADGSERIYSAQSTEGKVYLKKISISLAERKKKRTPVKYPLCSTFCTKNKHRSILLLPQHELRKLARHGGRTPVFGFNHSAKVGFFFSFCSTIFFLISIFFLLIYKLKILLKFVLKINNFFGNLIILFKFPS